eukprot:761369-Pyramimonas_sp.AAC.1
MPVSSPTVSGPVLSYALVGGLGCDSKVPVTKRASRKSLAVRAHEGVVWLVHVRLDVRNATGQHQTVEEQQQTPPVLLHPHPYARPQGTFGLLDRPHARLLRLAQAQVQRHAFGATLGARDHVASAACTC